MVRLIRYSSAERFGMKILEFSRTGPFSLCFFFIKPFLKKKKLE